MQWLNEHPQFLENQLYVGGESYSGLLIPILVQQILLGNICGWGGSKLIGNSSYQPLYKV